MIVIALREKIAGADIDKDAGEQCQANAERVLLNLQHHGRCRSGNGRGGVDQKPAKSGAITSSVSQYHAYRVDAVGKVVREHRGGDDGADGRGLPPTLRPGHATDRLADPVLDDADAQWLQLAVELTGDQPAPQQLRRRRRIVREDWLRRPLPHRRQR